jgi:hypothetical protein
MVVSGNYRPKHQRTKLNGFWPSHRSSREVLPFFRRNSALSVGKRISSPTKIKPGAQRPNKWKGKTMKNPINKTSQLNRAVRAVLIVAGAGLLAAATPTIRADTPGVLPPQSHAFGKTYAEWLAAWWQWSLAFPVSADPEYGTADISANQSGHVWFLPKPLGGGTTTYTATVPAGTALFVPVMTLEADNTGCPTYTDFTADQLGTFVQGGWGFATETSCTIDGVAVAGMEDPQNTPYFVQTAPFGYTVASHDNVLANYPGFVDETCIPDGTSVFPTVAGGVCVLIAPMSVGLHTIHLIGMVPAFGLDFDVTFQITVAPGH